MKVSKHLCMLLSTVDLIFVIIIHWLTLSKNFKESKTECCTTYHERENIWPRHPGYYENFTGFRLTNALCLKFWFSPKTALHYVAPLYIQDLLTIYSPTRNLRSSSSNLLAGTFSNLKTYRVRAFGMTRIRISDARSLGSYGISNEPMNPCPEWIHRFIWSAIWSEWSQLTDPDPDHLIGTHPIDRAFSVCAPEHLTEHLVNIYYVCLYVFQVNFYCPFLILDVLLVNLKVYTCNV